MNPYIWLGLAIVFEIAATSLLKYAAAQPTVWSVIGVALAYGTAFFFLAQALMTLGVGEAYALWSAIGTLGIFVIGAVIFGEAITAMKIAGAILIVLGIIFVKAG